MISVAAAFCLLAQADWIDRLGDDDPALRDQASAELRGMGSRAVPDLELALFHRSPEVRARAADLLDLDADYVLRTLERRPEFAEFRRRWNALIDGVIWKRPIPKDLWEELGDPVVELREISRAIQERPHSPLDILRELNDQAAGGLRIQAEKVGIQGADPELLSSRSQVAGRVGDLIAPLIAAHADAESFEEIYGTLFVLEREGVFFGCDQWGWADRRQAVGFLVDLRRRQGAPPLAPPRTVEEALALARRGPILRGMADGLGRAFANRGRGLQMLQELEKVEKRRLNLWPAFFRVYDRLLALDQQIGLQFYHPDLLAPAHAAIPSRHAPVPEKHEDLFGRVCAVPETDGALRVVREILCAGLTIEDSSETAELLREIGRRVDRAAGVP